MHGTRLGCAQARLPLVSPDGTLTYYVDSPTGRIDVFDWSSSTGLANRRPFVVVTRATAPRTG